jgi:acetoin utilization protein AcuB
MIAKELISTEIPSLHLNHTGDDAMAIMGEYCVRHLPIIQQDELLGLISEDIVLEHDPELPFTSYRLAVVCPFVRERDHVYEIMRQMNVHKLTVIPVVGQKSGKFVGVITLNDLLKYFAESASLSEPGSIVVLEVNRFQYSLSQIARIVESEGGIILNSFIRSIPDSNEMQVTIKIGRPDIRGILNAFERYRFNVVASFTEEEYIETLQEHYDSLMSYLNV